LARKIPSAASLDLFQEIGNVMVVFSKVRDYTAAPHGLVLVDVDLKWILRR
jgi:hypothetical protein